MRWILIVILALRAAFPMGMPSVVACADMIDAGLISPSSALHTSCCCCCDPASCPCEIGPAPAVPQTPRESPVHAPADTPRLVLLSTEPTSIMTIGWMSDAPALILGGVALDSTHPMLGASIQAAHCIWRT